MNSAKYSRGLAYLDATADMAWERNSGNCPNCIRCLIDDSSRI